MNSLRLMVLTLVAAFVVSSCKDTGTGPSNNPNPPGPTAPSIAAVMPDSAAVGDTVKIVGSSFGATRGTSVVRFFGVPAVTYVSWSSTQILVAVPGGVSTGAVSVAVDTLQSGSFPFKLLAVAEPRVSFAGSVAPLFASNGCTGCHGGSGGLSLDTYANLMSGGSSHGPVVDPYNGEGSVLIKKLRGTAGFGVQMPASGSPLSNPSITLISRWIKQGAKNN